MSIIELDDATIRQIAAGEVVERPSSVVKELLENSLDAGASRIDVGIDRGGKDRIRVADDGVGMTRDEVQLAVQEHTTSKITDITDLETGLRTLGFRGEALYAISAVSTMTITTKSDDGDQATELTVKHGDIVDIGPAGRPAGTTVEVTDLFAETPARRKFLKADATEFDHVNQMVTRYALANPDVAISLLHDDHEVFATTGQGDLQGALLSVYGREVAESMIKLPDGDMVSGYVSHPETNRSTRDYLSTYINGRYVQSNLLRRTIVDAYKQQLPSNRYPFAVLFLDLDPEAIDVNVHPRKLEVRFDDEQAITDAVRSTVREALLDHGIIRSTAPRGRSAPAETEISPENASSAPEADSDGSVTSKSTGDQSSAPGETIESTSTDSPAERGEAPADDRGDTDIDSVPDAVESSSTDRQREAQSSSSPSETTGSDTSATGESKETEADESQPDEPATDPHQSSRFTVSGTQLTLDADDVEEATTFERLPRMRILGQVHETYLIGETDDGLVLIDQHAADERINYERLQDRLAAERTTQKLAEPVELDVTGREAAVFPTYAEALQELGFHAEQTDNRTLTIEAVPAVFNQTLEPDLLRDVLVEFLQREATTETSVDARTEALLGDLACYPAITGNTSLTEGSVTELLEALDACDNPYACPHGRPVVIEISEQELQERFERDYPGHAQ